MVIPSIYSFLIDPLASNGSAVANSVDYPLQNQLANSVDSVSVSDSGRRLLENFHAQSGSSAPVNSPTLNNVVHVSERPSAEQSANLILGFIDRHLQSLLESGADGEALDEALGEALKGTQQGIVAAKQTLSSFGLLSEDVSNGIEDTEQLIFDGIEKLRSQYLGGESLGGESLGQESLGGERTIPTSPQFIETRVVQGYSVERTEVSSNVEAASNGNNVKSLATSFLESYQRTENVELRVRTQDGDVVALSFNASFSSDSHNVFAANSSRGGSSAILAYQRNASSSSNFNFTVQGELDSDEQEALVNLLQQVSELSSEFFNGDFDKAFAMAVDLKMDASEFSSLSVDLARTTRARIVESYVVNEVDAERAIQHQGNVVEQLLTLLEQANKFEQPELLLADLLANQQAQLALLTNRELTNQGSLGVV